MTYAITVSVRFDPSFLCEHNWQYTSLGLAKFLNARTCAKCGETLMDIPTTKTVGGINRQGANFWRSSANGV